MAEDIRAAMEKERSFLDRSGITIFWSASGDETLSLHRAEKTDLIVAMLDGPGMSGEELCSAIRDDAELRNVSIIILCSDTEEHSQRCFQCRANAFVTYPVNTAVLLQEAHSLLNIAPRRALRVPIDVDLDIQSGKANLLASSVDISESGMYLKSSALIPEGETITCFFDLPGTGRITVNAIVIRANEGEPGSGANYYGIAFVEPGKDVLHAIKQFVRGHGGT